MAIRIILSVDISVDLSVIKGSPFHKTTFFIQRTDWNSFRDFIPDVLWINTLKLPVENCAPEDSFRVKAGIIAFVSSRKYQLKPQSFLWFTPARTAAIADSNHCLCVWQRDAQQAPICVCLQ